VDSTFAGMAVSGDNRGFVYVGDTKNGLSIYNDLTSQCVSSGSINCYFNAVTSVNPVQDLKAQVLSDNKHYLAMARDAGNKGEFRLYDIEKYPLTPVRISTLTSFNCGTYQCIPEAVDLERGPDLAYLAIAAYGYQIVDLTDPANPGWPMGGVGNYFDPCSGCDWTYDLITYGDYTYLADGAMGLVVVKNNLSAGPPYSASPSLVSTYYPSGNPSDLQVKNGRLFLSRGRGGMDVYNLTLPESPKLFGNVDTPGVASGLFSDGSNWAYVADLDTVSGGNNGLRVVNINPVISAAEPVKLTIVGNWTDPLLNHVSRVFVTGNYAYICADKLYIINVTNQTAPAKVGEYSITSPRDVAVSGSYAYVINQDTLAVLDVGNHASPVLKGSATIVNGQAIAYANGLVYVADGDSGLKIYDVSDPQNVTLRGTYTNKAAYDVDLWGDYAFVAADSSGLVMLDISNPASPILQVSQSITAPQVVNRVSVYYDAGSHYYYAYTLNGEWTNKPTNEITLDQLSVIGIR
jgi:hypothetical protein